MPNRRDPDAAGRGQSEPPRGVPEELSHLPWALPPTFLGLDDTGDALGKARAVILPVPYESTTSWGTGTRYGPDAILRASKYVELYDPDFDCEPAERIGIHTLPALQLTRAGAGEAAAELERCYGEVAEAMGERFVVALGGEHSVSAPMIRAVAARAEERVTVLQLDAHADLRQDFEGTPHSHACAMARVLDVADVVAVGVRGVSQEEVEVSRENAGSTLIWSHEMVDDDTWMDRAIDALGPIVYLTFDVDYFDPSMMPSTGTPEPGGGDWHRTLRFLRRVFEERSVIAADVVELAPTPGITAPDFLTARLIYKLITYRFFDRLG